jgi:predicted SnoaL-like aldol condensation-catalyzing enzyme
MKRTFLLLVLVILALVVASPAFGGNSAQEEMNKKNVVAFYDAFINQKDFEAAAKYVGSRYTQHNPMGADNLDGIKNFVEFLREKAPKYHTEFKRVFADGDYVIIHAHAKMNPEDRGFAVMDIFKVEDGKVVEHWDVVQAIPEKAFNSNTMF